MTCTLPNVRYPLHSSPIARANVKRPIKLGLARIKCLRLCYSVGVKHYESLDWIGSPNTTNLKYNVISPSLLNGISMNEWLWALSFTSITNSTPNLSIHYHQVCLQDPALQKPHMYMTFPTVPTVPLIQTPSFKTTTCHFFYWQMTFRPAQNVEVLVISSISESIVKRSYQMVGHISLCTIHRLTDNWPMDNYIVTVLIGRIIVRVTEIW